MGAWQAWGARAGTHLPVCLLAPPVGSVGREEGVRGQGRAVVIELYCAQTQCSSLGQAERKEVE